MPVTEAVGGRKVTYRTRDAGTRGGDTGTWGRGCGDMGTWRGGCGDVGTWGGDTERSPGRVLGSETLGPNWGNRKTAAGVLAALGSAVARPASPSGPARRSGADPRDGRLRGRDRRGDGRWGATRPSACGCPSRRASELSPTSPRALGHAVAGALGPAGPHWSSRAGDRPARRTIAFPERCPGRADR